MVASRDIKPGEVIFIESPLTFGPSENTKPVCLGCYRKIKKSSCTKYLCPSCGFPMCSKGCENIPEHRDFECKLFNKSGFKPDVAKFNYKGERTNLDF